MFISIFILLIFIHSCRNKERVITIEMAARGGEIFNSVGCIRCHSMSVNSMYGPSLNFTIGQEITVLRKGRLINIELDRKYILRSMTDPDFEKPEGYMQRNMSKIELPNDEIESITDYLIFINERHK